MKQRITGMKLMGMFLNTVIMLCACSGGVASTHNSIADSYEESIYNSKTSETEKRATDTPTIDMWINSGVVKVLGSDKISKDSVTETEIKMAKNEDEFCQISLNSGKAVRKISLKVNESYDGIAIRIMKEYLISCGNEKWPDALVPLNGTFNLKKNETSTFLIGFTADKNAKSGDYKYSVSLIDESGNELGKCKITVHIWDFALPDVASCGTAFEIFPECIKRFHKYDENDKEAAIKIYKSYYDLMLSYKVLPFDLPYEITDPRADEYMSDSRVTSFRIKWEEDDETLTAIYSKLSENPEWMKKAFFYAYDEPINISQLDELKKRVDRIRNLCPGIDINVSYYMNVQYDENRDQIDFMTPLVDVLTAKSICWIDDNIYSTEQMKTKASFSYRMNQLKQEGKKIWWYVCAGPGYPYCNLRINDKGIWHRQLFWQQYEYGVEGFLYWCANCWQNTNDPWQDMETVKTMVRDVYGDGSVLYPGSTVNIDGACPSLRLEMIRDGIEDYDLFNIASDLFGKKWVIDMIEKTTPSLTDHSDSEDLFIQLRNEIGDAIENAVKNK